MPRYVVQRTFPVRLRIPATAELAAACLNVANSTSGFDLTCPRTNAGTDQRTTRDVADGSNSEGSRNVVAWPSDVALWHASTELGTDLAGLD
jgi:hypothetical protein